jgi:hypothetical protein
MPPFVFASVGSDPGTCLCLCVMSCSSLLCGEHLWVLVDGSSGSVLSSTIAHNAACHGLMPYSSALDSLASI